ncbi:MAG: hypothetical protein M3Q30_10165 [Actinomycetota bacterium]|nr:hypothetical protein [Actinomycetota bacterium]
MSFSNVGRLNSSTPLRLTLALVGAGLVLAGIATALAKSMQLASASTTVAFDLTRVLGKRDQALRSAREEVARDAALQYWQGDLNRFVAAYERAQVEFLHEANAFARDPNPNPDRADLGKAEYRLQTLGRLVTTVLETVAFLRLQRAFEAARRTIVTALVAASIGAIAFAWATTGAMNGSDRVRPVAAQCDNTPRDRHTYFRYVGTSELSAIRDTDLLKGGRGRSFWTNASLNSAHAAQSLLALPQLPTYRVAFKLCTEGEGRVHPDFGQPGGGYEYWSDLPVAVTNVSTRRLTP